MAGRIRTIKPEILDDERTANLTHDAWRLFVSMIVLADDYGNLRAREHLLGASAFWARPPSRPISDLLEELAKLDDDGSPGLVTLYRVGSERFAHLNGWSKNQRVDHPGKPRCPRPTDGTVTAPASDPRAVEGLFDRSNGARATNGAKSPELVASHEKNEDSREPRESLGVDLRSPISDHRSPTTSSRAHAHARVAPTVPLTPAEALTLREAEEAARARLSRPPPERARLEPLGLALENISTKGSKS